MKTKSFIKYLLYSYPHKSELSKARLQKMVYLCDWKSSLDHNRQITNIHWYFNQYGPYVPNVIDRILEDPDVHIRSEITFYGGKKEVLSLNENASLNFLNDLESIDKSVADYIINQTKKLNWNRFIELVYDTYPVRVSMKYESLDLVNLAASYRHKKVNTI